MEPAEPKPVALVVEDDDQIAFIIQFVLDQQGFAVHRAASGRETAELMKTLPPPAVVTLDIRLPDANGVDLILEMKSAPGWERVPIVMVTATPKDDQVNWAIKSGAKAYIVKPFRPEQLRDVVGKIMSGQKEKQ